MTSLEGQEIEPYANELFRSWKLGEKTKNNGVLLLVAPNERRVRIEVGYGLEGTLTDALSKVIIANAITPRFKAGDFSGGISRGVDDIITVLTTDASEWQKRPSLRLDNQQTADPANWLLIAAFIVLVTLLIVSPGFRWLFLNMVLNILVSSGGSSGGGYSAAVLRVAAAFPEAAARRAAAGLRGAGDEYFERRSRAHRERHPCCRGENLGRDRLRAGADVIPRDGVADLYRGGSRAGDALVADGFHGDDGLPNSVAAGRRIFRALIFALPAARAGRADAAQGAPRHRLSRRHGAVHQPWDRAKQGSSGILIFVSLAERYARIIADDEIAARVPQSRWQAAVDALIAHMRDGRVADGFIAAIEMCGGNELARHFPRTDASRNELPDRIYLI